MTDAGEKLRVRIQKWLVMTVPNAYMGTVHNSGADLRVIVEEAIRAELERAAGIAEQYNEGFTGGGTGGQWTCMQRIAAAIRKLKE